MLLVILIKILIFILLLVSILVFLNILKERNIAEKISDNIDKISKNYEERIINLKYKQYYKSSSKKNNYIDKLDILIEKANIRNKLKFFTSEVLLFISLLLGTFTFILTFYYLYNILAAITLSLTGFFIPELILKIIANRNAKKVDMYLVNYVGILENFCYIKDDIVYSITNAIPYLKEPLQSYNKKFILSIKYGTTTFDALEELKNKVDNKRFKMLIKNLQLCSKYNGKFVEVLKESKDSLINYGVERGKRNKAVQRTRFAIMTMVVICAGLIIGVIRINPFLMIALKKDFTGQIIVVYNIVAIIYAIYKSIIIEKFDY